MNNRIRKGSSSNICKKQNKILFPKEPFIYHPLQWYHCLLSILSGQHILKEMMKKLVELKYFNVIKNICELKRKIHCKWVIFSFNKKLCSSLLFKCPVFGSPLYSDPWSNRVKMNFSGIQIGIKKWALFVGFSDHGLTNGPIWIRLNHMTWTAVGIWITN